jgi:hypothetical protein
MSYFVAIDGEGITEEGIHKYVLLCSSQGNYIKDIDGLSTVNCLAFLCEAGKNAGTKLVGFGISYDVNMMLRDLSRDDLTTLNSGSSVEYCGYVLTYRSRKAFEVKHIDKTITLWDTHGFFQSSFIRALEAYDIPVNKVVEEGKANRSSFTRDELLERMVPYCLQECWDLVKLCNKLAKNFATAGLFLSRFDGAGAAASALLRREGVKKYFGEGVPYEVNLASRHAYFGGRIECIRYGNSESDITTLDINSAYPYAATLLPSLKSGQWYHNNSDIVPSNTLSVVHIKWEFPFNANPFFPFPFRYENGAIVFPNTGEGWYWLPEVKTALNYPVFKRGITIIESYEWVPDSDYKPFSFLHELFQLRLKWKQEGNGAEKALKLAINSLYGKMAQRVGYKTGDFQHIPPYHKLEWAGFITSYTRAELLKCAMQAPKQCISLQTDGVFFEGDITKDLTVQTGDGFGEWGIGIAKGITIVQSGVYWLNTLLDKPIEHYRGFDANSLNRTDILKAWKQRLDTYSAPSTRFITMGTACGSDSEYKLWCKWITADRQLTLRMQDINCKRIDISDTDKPHLRLIRTYATPNLEAGNISHPHVLPWDSSLKQTNEESLQELDVTI